MSSDLEPRVLTSSEVIAGIKHEIEDHRISSATFEIHYHAGAPAAPAPVCTHTHAPRTTDRIKEWVVIAILGEIVLGTFAVIAIMLVPAIMSLAAIMSTFMIGFAIAVVAVAAAIRSLRYSRADVQMAKRRR